MRYIVRIVAAVAAMLTFAAPFAVHRGAQPAAPAAHVAVHTASLATGCNTTVTDTPTNFSGWHWRTTQEVCNDPMNQYDCLTVDKVNPAAIPPVVNLTPRTCIYPRLR